MPLFLSCFRHNFYRKRKHISSFAILNNHTQLAQWIKIGPITLTSRLKLYVNNLSNLMVLVDFWAIHPCFNKQSCSSRCKQVSLATNCLACSLRVMPVACGTNVIKKSGMESSKDVSRSIIERYI